MIRTTPARVVNRPVTRRGLLAGAAGAAGLATMSGLAACSSSDSDDAESSSSSSDDSSDSTQVLNLVLTSDLQTLDVNDVRNSNEFDVLSQVHEGLFRTFSSDDGTDDVQCAGCESYEVSDDGLIYTFYLRENYWSDGEPVIAQHYVDSILRLCNPDNGFSYAFLAEDIAGAQDYMDGVGSEDDVAVVAEDDYTLVITLANPIPFFSAKLSNLCFAPIRQDLIDENGESMATDYTLQVYSGPFVISNRVLENSITLTPNEYYWDAENVQLQEATFTLVEEDATRSQLLNSGELDAVDGETEYVSVWEELAEAGSLVYNKLDDVGSDYLAFNHHTGGPSGLMNNVKCRKAIACCFSREDFNETAQAGLQLAAHGLIPFGILSGDVEYRSTYDEPLLALMEEYDTTEKCQALFAEGVEEVTGSSDVSDVTLTILTLQSSTLSKTMTEWLAQQIAAGVGVTVDINSTSESSTFVTERDSYNYDFYLMGWNADFNDPISYFDLFCTDSGYAKYMGGYSDEDYDADYNSLKTMADSDERTEVYQRLEQNLIDNAAIAPVYYTVRHEFQQTYVQDLSLPQFGCGFEFTRAYISDKEA